MLRPVRGVHLSLYHMRMYLYIHCSDEELSFREVKQLLEVMQLRRASVHIAAWFLSF